MAYAACQQNTIEPWSQWAKDNFCNTTEPPSIIPYATGDIMIPNWAYQNLANGQFNLDAAVQREPSFATLGTLKFILAFQRLADGLLYRLHYR